MSPANRRGWRRSVTWLATVALAAVAVTCVANAEAATIGAAGAAVNSAATPAPRVALVVQDQVSLKAAARESAPAQTLLWRGEVVEWRAERGDHVQVWDHHRERGGYVRAAQLLLLDDTRDPVAAAEAMERLMAMLAYVQLQPGSETMGLGLAAAVIQLAPAVRLQGRAGAQVFEAIGLQADRLAERASSSATRSAREQAALSAHLDVAARHGVRFHSLTAADRVTLCYDGDAWRRLLASPAASADQKARAALALTRSECQPPDLHPRAREQADRDRAALLQAVPTAGLGPVWQQRMAWRTSAVHSSLAYAAARRGEPGAARDAARQAWTAYARVETSALVEEDVPMLTAAAMRLNAVRWALVTPGGSSGSDTAASGALTIRTRVQSDGQTCVVLEERRQGVPQLAVERCTWGLVWTASASASREGQALALAVQMADGWRELWVFRRSATGWTVDVLPPAAAEPGLGVAEFAGWVPGGRQLLVAREAVAEGRTLRRFEVVPLDTLVAERVAFEPEALGAFQRWADPGWKASSPAHR